MIFNDEQLLSPDQYEVMAKAYSNSLKQKGFVFVSFDKSGQGEILSEVFDLLCLLRDHLFALGGFLGTGAMYNLNEKHILALQKIFDYDFNYSRTNLLHDKTKLFLNMLSLENILLSKLLDLAFASDNPEEILAFIKERTALSGSLYKINGIIASFRR